jgi:hypothetical protein
MTTCVIIHNMIIESDFVTGNALLISCVYAPFIWKINFKMLKNLRKNMYMYIFIFYVVTQSFMKNGYSLCPIKKIKICMTKRPILVPNLLFLHRPYKKLVHVETTL